MRLSVIIPVYNEEQTIHEVLERVAAVDLGAIEMEIVVANDGSTDGTRRAIDDRRLPPDLPVHVYHSPINLGKGAAVRLGLGFATGDVLLIQDADLEYDPADHDGVIRPILERRCDAVMGSRFLLERPTFIGKRRSPYFTHYIGNLMIGAFTNLLYGKAFTDYEACFKAFLRSDLLATSISADGFEFDNELVCKLFRRGVRFEEVPVRYSPRTYERGKKIGWRDGVIILWTILKWRVAPLASFAPGRATGNGSGA